MEEYFFICPYCWQKISMLVETSVSEQIYIEDCEVCCQPISIHYGIDPETLEVSFFEATPTS